MLKYILVLSAIIILTPLYSQEKLDSTTDDERLKELLKEPIIDLVGHQLPYGILEDIFRKSFNTSELIGKPSVLFFWFTTCQPCIDNLPIIDSIFNEFGGIASVIGITSDSPYEIQPVLETYNVRFPQMVNSEDYVKGKIGIKFFPKIILVDRDGIIEEVLKGPILKDQPELNRILKDFLDSNF